MKDTAVTLRARACPGGPKPLIVLVSYMLESCLIRDAGVRWKAAAAETSSERCRSSRHFMPFGSNQARLPVSVAPPTLSIPKHVTPNSTSRPRLTGFAAGRRLDCVMNINKHRVPVQQHPAAVRRASLFTAMTSSPNPSRCCHLTPVHGAGRLTSFGHIVKRYDSVRH